MRAGPERAAVLRIVPGAIACAACAAALALLLFATGRPVATDDLWWHLALGRSFAREGPWLAGDPLLFTAPRPAATASWLADVALAGVQGGVGFSGLRIAHVAIVAGIFAFAGLLLRRESGSFGIACAALIAFATLFAYPAFQLRPHLATTFATLLLYRIALRVRDGPSPLAIAVGAGVMALWANLHGAFLLGPVFVGSAMLGVLAAPIAARRGVAPPEGRRIARLAALLVAGGLASLANPAGFAQYLAYFIAGAETPALSDVVDEWIPLDPFAFPRLGPTPPSPASWLVFWGLLLATIALTAGAVRDWRRSPGSFESLRAPAALDPALVALAWLALGAACIAVRLEWLGLFPLLLIAQAYRSARAGSRARRALRWLPALASLLLLAGFVSIGPWPRISRDVPTSWRDYRQPYATWDYFADPIWLIRDAGLEGRLFTAYDVGGFAGFWLAPKVGTFINGSLNVTPDVMSAYWAISARRGERANESFPALLDRFGVDLFHGVRMPQAGLSEIEHYTTGHLERTAGWKPIFRNVRSSLYLRDDARNAANLRRIADAYASDGVPFDPQVGFEPDRVIRERPDWAIRHGLVPANFEQLKTRSVSAGDPRRRIAAIGQVATWYALLGLYEDAIDLDTQILAANPGEAGPRRRRVWCLLRAGLVSDARREAERLEAADPLTREIAKVARRSAGDPPPDLESWIRRLPLLTPAQVRSIASELPSPPVR